MRLSIVTTLFRSAPFIEEFYRRSIAAAERLTDDIEIIMVNDGSPDESLTLAVELHRRDPRVIVVDLSRNFGHHRAMMVGLNHASGDLVFLIDSDLDEAPELLNAFYARMQDEGCDVVYGVQATRRGAFDAVTANLFYWTLGRLGGLDIPRNLATVRLMSRRYVRSLVRHREREMLISGLWVLTGYHQVPHAITKAPSAHKSNYSFSKRVRLAVDHLTAFSDSLLYASFFFGLAVSAIAFLMTMYFVTLYLRTGLVLAGWTSIIASVWMFGGASLFLIGLVGIYVARIFNETKRRPYAIVRELYAAGDREEPTPSLMQDNEKPKVRSS